jgi:hypothetical protein
VESRESFERSPTKSTRRASRQLFVTRTFNVTQSATQEVDVCIQKIQLVKQLKPADGMARQHFAEEMFDSIDLGVDFFEKIMFRDEATFHVPGKAHRHNVRIWGTKKPRVV